MPVSVGELLAYLRLDSSGFDRGIRVAQTEMRTATGTADRMGAAVGATGERLTGAGRAANVAASGSAKYRAAQLSLVAAQERYNAVLNQGNASTARLASAEASVIRANDRVASSSRTATTAVSELGAAQGRSNAVVAATPGLMNRTATGFAGAARSAVGLGAAFGAFELFRKAIDITKEANDFQRQMVLIRTNADVTASEVTKASGALLSMSGEVAAAPKDLAVAFYHAKSVGLDYAKAIDTTRIAAEGAKVGNGDLEETMNALTSTVASGIPGVSNMSSAMGQLIAIVGSGDMKLEHLNEALGTGILLKMKGYGLSLTDVGAALATFGDANIRGADAATMLRMAVEAMAKQGAPGVKALASIGIKADQLRDDMQKGGLNKAILDLNAHMKAAGITGNRVGGFLLDAFSKKGAGGVTALIGEVDRLESKFKILRSAGSSFDDKWKATTETASFALSRLGHMAEAAGISLTARLGPSIASAATWLGTTLPHAVSVLAHIIGPTASMVGTVFVGAWHALSAVLSVVGSALAGVGGFLEHHKVLVTTVATAVLTMWAAYKTYRIGVAAIKAIDIALGALSMRMTRMGGAMAGARGGLMGLSAASVAGSVALIGVGAVIGAITYKMQRHAQAVAQAKALTADYVGVLQQTKGAINDQVVAMTTQKLAESGAYEAAKKYGISLTDVTQAALGNAAAHDRIVAATHNSYDATRHVLVPTLGLGIALGDAAEQYKIATSQTKANTTASKDNAATSAIAAAAASANAAHQKQVAAAEKAAADAAKRLDTALQALSGHLGARQALDQYRQGVQQLKGNLDKANHSLIGNSAAAVANRLAVDNVVQSALQYGQALKAQGKTQPQINSALQKQVGFLIDNAKQLGLNKKELIGYLKQLHLTPSQIHTAMGLDTNDARAKMLALLQWFKSLTWVAHVTSDGTVNAGTTGSKAHVATGGYISGPGTGTSDSVPAMLSNGEYVINARQTRRHRGLLEAVNSGRGYASGGSVTLNPHSFQTSLGKDASSEKYAFQQLLTIGTKAGISSGLAKHLVEENKVLGVAINERNRLADKLKKDNQRLADAQKKLAAEAAAVKGAITGSFDVTSAGAGFDGQQPITGANMIAEEKQAATRAHAFVVAIKKLKGKIGAGYLYQLAEKGPSALPEAQALLSLNTADLSAFNSAAGALNSSGNQLGSFIGDMRFGGEVRRDKATVAADAAREKRAQARVDRLGNRIVKQLENGIKHLSHPHMTVYLDGKKIATAVAAGNRKNGTRN